MEPYILVLAKTPQEAATYIKRAELPRGRWRIASSASSIRGIRRAHVHALDSFHTRPDRFAVLAELKWAKCDWFDVEMPEAPAIDEGDGMGPQLSLEILSNVFARPFRTPEQAELAERMSPEGRAATTAGAIEEIAADLAKQDELLEQQRALGVDPEAIDEKPDPAEVAEPEAPVAPKPKKPRQRATPKQVEF